MSERRLEQLLIETAMTYIALPLSEFDDAVNKSLQQIGTLTDADRLYVFQYHDGFTHCSNTHEWCASGVEPQIQFLQNYPMEGMDEWLDAHQAGCLFMVNDVLLLAEESVTRQTLEPQGIRSLITAPITSSGECLGFVGLDFVKQPISFNNYHIKLITLFGQLLANIELRKRQLIDKDRILTEKLRRKEVEKQLLNEQQRLNTAMHHDLLTGLANRSLFEQLLNVEMTRSQRDKTTLVLLYIDLDNFAMLNQQLGQEHGDALLIDIAKRLQASVREPHHIARIGGDEFALILTDCEFTSTANCTAIEQRILRTIAAPYQIEEGSVNVTASIGLTSFPQSQMVDAEQLLRQADQAMYQAKLAGKHRHYRFNTEQDSVIRHRHELIQTIQAGIKNNEFALFYQPQIDMRTNQVLGFEALIRWQHPKQGLLSPGFFLPATDNQPVAKDIDVWVVSTALNQLSYWKSKGLHTRVSINISNQLLLAPEFIPLLKAALRHHIDVSPNQLEIEILESGALDDLARAAAVVTSLHQLGIRCALDDFGTGYSSLTFLKRLLADVVKIDQSFVADLLLDNDHQLIVNSVIGLCQNLGRHVLAEGIETAEQAEQLKNMGCYWAQGYWFAKPMPASDVLPWHLQWTSMQA